MKKVILFLVAVLVFPLVLASSNISEDYNLYSDINTIVKINSTIPITSSSHDIEYILANLSFYPRQDAYQTILSSSQVSDPEATVTTEGGNIIYTWRNPTEDSLYYAFSLNVKSRQNFLPITSKVSFPLPTITDSDIKSYLQPTEKIQSKSATIIAKANELASGETDEYILIFNIASWIKKNIEYDDTDPRYVEEVLNAETVLAGKKGVCDEFTVLFASMARALGIPTKYVSGMAYSNKLNEFGPHAWAEVYFPNYGWVAVDPTYGELGNLDATHIKFQESASATESSVGYKWRAGEGTDIGETKLAIDTQVVSAGAKIIPPNTLTVTPLKDEVGPDSYIPVEIKIENLNPYYLPLTLYITKAPEEIKDNLLFGLAKPEQIKKVYTIIHVPSNLRKGYSYTGTIEIQDNYGNTNSKTIEYSADYSTYTLAQAQAMIDSFSVEEQKEYSSSIDISCSSEREAYYTYEQPQISCLIKNRGNTILQNINLCADSLCNTFDLNIAEEKQLMFNLSLPLGQHEIKLKAENKDISKLNYVTIEILESPQVLHQDIKFPEQIDYNQRADISFILKTKTELKDVDIRLGRSLVLHLDDFKSNKQIIIPFEGKAFYNKELKLKTTYKDINGKEYFTETPISIEVTNAPFYAGKGYVFVGIGIVITLAIVYYLLRSTGSLPKQQHVTLSKQQPKKTNKT